MNGYRIQKSVVGVRTSCQPCAWLCYSRSSTITDQQSSERPSGDGPDI